MTPAQKQVTDADVLALEATVRLVAARVHTHIQRFPIEDARQAAWEGAIRAVRTFDPARGVKIETYAYTCALRATLTDARRFLGCQTRTLSTLGRADAFRDNYIAEHGDQPSDKTIEAAVPGYLRAAAALNVGDFNGAIAATTPAVTPEDVVITTQTLATAIAPLDARRRQVLFAHAVLEQTFQEIGDDLGVQRERAFQLFKRATTIALSASLATAQSAHT